MSVIKEMLMMAAGLIFTVTLVVMSLDVYKKAENLGRVMVSREEQQLKNAFEYELYRYEDREVDGSRVVSYIRKMYGIGNTGISVTNAYSTFEINDLSIENIRDINSRFYINPMKKYRIVIEKNDNDEIDKITITERRG